MKVNRNIELSDGKLLVRPYRVEDAEALYEAARESVAEISPWLPWCHPGYSIDEARAFMLSREDEWAGEGEYSFGVFDKETLAFFGGVGLNQFSRTHQMANLGYWIRTSATRRGAASGAARLVAQFGFRELGLQRIEIVAALDNFASQRVAEKTGARREGVLRKRLLIHTQSQDAVLFSLVAEDFPL